MYVDMSNSGRNYTRNLYAEALDHGYGVLTDNTTGHWPMQNKGGDPICPYDCTKGAETMLLDLTNPEARTWYKGVIKENMLRDGHGGWMNDFGEALPITGISLHDGSDPLEFHGRYPEEWAKLVQEAIAEENMQDEVVFFSRSRGLKGPSYSPVYWQGDQLPSWDDKDGLKSTITGLLTAGLSGMSILHSDIGGYTTTNYPGTKCSYSRSGELQRRWAEASAFTSAFRSHEGTYPPGSHQVYTDADTIRHFSYFAKVFAAWQPLRKALMIEAAATGLPIARPLLVHYPELPQAWSSDTQWLLGDTVMVAPVYDEGGISRSVLFPTSEASRVPGMPCGGNTTWVHLWTGKEYCGGHVATVAAPIYQPPVFYDLISISGLEFAEDMRRAHLIN